MTTSEKVLKKLGRPKLVKPPLPAIVNDYLDHIANTGKSPNTVLAYRTDIESFVNFVANRGVDVLTAMQNDVDAFVGSTSKLVVKNNTVARRLTVLRSFYNFTVAQKLRPTNPALAIAPPLLTKPQPHFLTKDEMNVMLNAVGKENTPENLRLLAILELLGNAGMKVSEAMTLKVDSPQISNLPKSVQESIANYMVVRVNLYDGVNSHNDFLFPSSVSGTGHFTRQQVANLIKNLAKTVGIANISPRTMRHTRAVQMLENGATVEQVKNALGITEDSTVRVLYKDILDKTV